MEAARGLTEAEAAARLARDGFNELTVAKRDSAFRLARDVLRQPMFALLLGAGLLYALIGDLAEALVLLLFATLSVSIAVIQKGRADRVIEQLRDLSSPRALVLRDGVRRRIPGREVVRGDLLVLTEGDRIPADAILLSGTDIRVVEGVLTGESMPVRKQPSATAAEALSPPGGEDTSALFAGTLLVAGTGLAEVIATGSRSEVGKLGLTLRNIEPEVPRLQAQTHRLVTGFAIVGGLLSVVVVLLYGFTRGDWVQALLGGIALGMSLLPEEFPLVLTVFSVMGAWRLSRARVLTRRAAVIETLGAATVLCTDKTGTLTQNAMNVVSLEAQPHGWQSHEDHSRIFGSESLSMLLETAAMACEPQGLDPMDRAVLLLAQDAPHRHADAHHVHAYPMRGGLLAVTHVWEVPDANHWSVAAKGAPEAIALLCRLDEQARQSLLQRVDALAQQGIRVLAVARGTLPKGQLPDQATDLSLQLTGLVGFADPLRQSVPAAVSECRNAGVRVVMITGDYPQTARAIAAQAGLEHRVCMTGAELDALDDPALAARVRDATVFARISPRQKLRIVDALKQNGEVVAMTGDGVNDAAALKAAHIGIAMGGRGTDVAREAASIVLLEDDFTSIVTAIRLGRRIYDNLRKALAYILAVHLPIAGLALLPVMAGAPLVLTPMLIAVMELLIDPACSIVLEAELAEADVMRRPPRNPQGSLASRDLITRSVVQGALALLVVAGVYLQATGRDLPPPQVRMSAFLALMSANLALLLANRRAGASWRDVLGSDNRLMWWGVMGTGVVLSVLMYWRAAGAFFGVARIGAGQVVVAVSAGVGLLVLLQLIKRVPFAKSGT